MQCVETKKKIRKKVVRNGIQLKCLELKICCYSNNIVNVINSILFQHFWKIDVTFAIMKLNC